MGKVLFRRMVWMPGKSRIVLFGSGSFFFVAILTFALYMAGVLVPTRREVKEGKSQGLRLFMLFGLSFVLVNASMLMLVLVQKHKSTPPG